jgi:RHH-type transcriptional regulator, proline utilization regulon repressor / proline dehydrogenase / delta 1-pyrroline-5-carboxylate dehydrogenase
VYDDPTFARRLADAVESLKVGAATDPSTKVGPVINEPSGPLRKALTSLENDESWLVEPKLLDETGKLWSPGVRMGVQPGSWFHLTECFGPVLGVMRADDLDHAIELQNATEYGLTGGLQSLDPKEIDTWLARVEVGNAYINRHITGAVVQRQPFGGWKRSTIGPGRKPGGPGHLHSYGTWSQDLDVDHARESFTRAWHEHYMQEHDPSGLRSERNILRYRPLTRVIIRFDGDEKVRATAALAANLTGVDVIWSDQRIESETELIARLTAQPEGTRIRLLAPATDEFRAAVHSAGLTIDEAPMTNIGMIELGRWVKEQAVSQMMHRYGRLITQG